MKATYRVPVPKLIPQRKPYPPLAVTAALFALLFAGMAIAIIWLLGVDDPIRLKHLIEDSGPVQGFGQTAIGLAFACALAYTVLDRERRVSYLFLSYLLMFYFLREADYHYKLSEHAKATQFKRFFLHEQIPLTSKLFLATIVILFLVVLYRYLRDHRWGLLHALQQRLPWAIGAAIWAAVFVSSQLVDQVPLFHTTKGQVFEEVFEASAEVIALLSLILFRVQLWGDRRGALGAAATST